MRDDTTRLRPDDADEWPIFLCYRQDDGGDIAEWLFDALEGFDSEGLPPEQARPFRLTVYFDQAAPAYEDWKAYHEPKLATARALIFISTPGAAIDFRESGGADDYVHEELDWWLANRSAAPILVDKDGRGERYLPQKVLERWPHAQRVEVRLDEWERVSDSEREVLRQRVVERIVAGIATSLSSIEFEEIEQRKVQRRRTRRLVASALAVTAIAAGVALWGVREANRREEIAFASRLTVESLDIESTDIPGLERKALLALEAKRRFAGLGLPSAEADASLRSSLRLYPRIEGIFETGDRSELREVAYNASGTEVLAAGEHGLWRWRLADGALADGALVDHMEAQKWGAVAFSNRGTHLAVAHYSNRTNGHLRVYEVASRVELGAIPFDERIGSVFISPKGRFVAARYDREGGSLWSVADGEKIHSFARSMVVAFDPNGEILAVTSLGVDPAGHGLWRLPSEDEGATLHRVDGIDELQRAYGVGFSGDGRRLFANHQIGGGEVFSFSPTSETTLRSINVSSGRNIIALGAGGDLLARSVEVGGGLEVLEVSTDTSIRFPLRPTATAFGEGDRLAIVDGHAVKAWVMSRPMLPRKFRVKAPDPQIHLAFRSAPTMLAALVVSGEEPVFAEIRTWTLDPTEGERSSSLRLDLPSVAPPVHAAIDATGRNVAIAAEKRAFHYDAETGQLVKEVAYDGTAVAFQLDGGRRLLLANERELIGGSTRGEGQKVRHHPRFYDLSTGESFVLSPEGRLVVAGDVEDLSVASETRYESTQTSRPENALGFLTAQPRVKVRPIDERIWAVTDTSGESEVARIVYEPRQGDERAVDPEYRFFASANAEQIQVWELNAFETACATLDRKALSAPEWHAAGGTGAPPKTCP